MEDDGHGGHGGQHQAHGQEQDRPPVGAQLPRRGVERGVVDERREEDQQDEVGLEARPGGRREARPPPGRRSPAGSDRRSRSRSAMVATTTTAMSSPRISAMVTAARRLPDGHPSAPSARSRPGAEDGQVGPGEAPVQPGQLVPRVEAPRSRAARRPAAGASAAPARISGSRAPTKSSDQSRWVSPHPRSTRWTSTSSHRRPAARQRRAPGPTRHG